MAHEVIAQTEELVIADPNIIEHALSHGHPKQQCVSPEQAEKIAEIVSNPPSPTDALRRAIMQANRFTFFP